MILDNKKRDVTIEETLGESSKGKENPPPYSAHLQVPRSPLPPRRVASAPNLANKEQPPLPPAHEPNATVTQLHLQTRGEPISGTYYIDPKIPSLGVDDRRKKSKKKASPHASFRTRQGTISLELATVGEARGESQKANLLVASRSGNINIKLLSMPPNRPRLSVEIYSQGGNIMLFLPRTFCGVLQLNTRKGTLHFLPAITAMMKVMNESEHEALVLFGDQSSNESSAADFCQLNSRHGKVIVGLSDIDKYEEQPGFWQKLKKIF